MCGQEMRTCLKALWGHCQLRGLETEREGRVARKQRRDGRSEKEKTEEMRRERQRTNNIYIGGGFIDPNTINDAGCTYVRVHNMLTSERTPKDKVTKESTENRVNSPLR